jgi:hypothetical protein
VKVFGIGLPKTGNHSLVEAMSILGFRAKHFPESDQEIADNDFSCGNPIVAEYRMLDRRYPGSKFVMMQRDDASWLRSIRAHMNRKPVDTLRPSRRDLRLKLYGTISPTDAQLLAHKREHEADVRRYFDGRCADLLDLAIVNGEGWARLCPFLNSPVLDRAFPKRNVTVT